MIAASGCGCGCVAWKGEGAGTNGCGAGPDGGGAGPEGRGDGPEGVAAGPDGGGAGPDGGGTGPDGCGCWEGAPVESVGSSDWLIAERSEENENFGTNDENFILKIGRLICEMLLKEMLRSWVRRGRMGERLTLR